VKVDVKNLDEITEKVSNQLIEGKVPFFRLVFVEKNGIISFIHFSPINPEEMHMNVMDYERLCKLLLTHPKVSDLEFNEKQSLFVAFFYER